MILDERETETSDQTAQCSRKFLRRMQMYYQVEKQDGYYRIGSPENVFSYLFVGSKKAALIDTGYGFGDLKSVVRSITDKPLIIINTHGHCDHTGGNAQFDEVCYIGEKDTEVCREHSEASMRKDNAERAKNSMNYESGETYNGLPDAFDMEAYCARGTGTLQSISEGACFELGGVTLKIYETPGHTKGGISVLYLEKNLLFIGDATGMFVWLFAKETTDLETYIAAVRKMYDLDAAYYIGSHNPNPIRREELLRYIRAAEEADYEKGEPFESFFGMEYEPRVCALDGKTLREMFQSDFASVVIGKDKRK